MAKLKDQQWSFYPWYVLFLALFAPLALYANNLGETTLSSLWLPVLISFVLGLLVFGVAYLFTRDWQKAGVITGISEVVIFSYGHIYRLVEGIGVFGIVVGRHRYLLPLFLLVLMLTLWQVKWHIGVFGRTSQVLNMVTLILVLFQLIRIVPYEIRMFVDKRQESANTPVVMDSSSIQYKPDI